MFMVNQVWNKLTQRLLSFLIAMLKSHRLQALHNPLTSLLKEVLSDF